METIKSIVELSKAIESFGIYAIVISGMVIMIYYLLKELKKERERLMDIYKENNDKLIEVIQKNTDILSGLKSLLESIDKRI